MSMIEEMFWSLNVSLFLYYKQNLLIRLSKPAAGWGVIKSIMQELVEIPLCINVVAKEMDEVGCSRMTWGKVLQSENYSRSHGWFCPVVSHANVLCTTPPLPPPSPPPGSYWMFSAGNTIGFFLFALFHTYDLECIKRKDTKLKQFWGGELLVPSWTIFVYRLIKTNKTPSGMWFDCETTALSVGMFGLCVNKHHSCSLTLSTGVIKLN